MGCCCSTQEEETKSLLTPSKSQVQENYVPQTGSPRLKTRKRRKQRSDSETKSTDNERESESQTEKESNYSTYSGTEDDGHAKESVKEKEKKKKKRSASKSSKSSKNSKSAKNAPNEQTKITDNEEDLNLPNVYGTRSMKKFFEETTWSPEQVHEIKSLFTFCDLDGNGEIGKDELKSMFVQMNVKISEEDLDAIFSNLDTNGDGGINFEEFLNGIRWLQKGATIEQDLISEELDDKEVLENLEKRFEVLVQYTGMVIQNSVKYADELVKKGDFETGKGFIDMIEPQTIKKIQELVQSETTTEIFPPKTEARLNKIKMKLAQQAESK